MVHQKANPKLKLFSLSSNPEIAEKYDLPVQSHLCENTNEIEFVKTLEPESKNYSDVFMVCSFLYYNLVHENGALQIREQ